MKQYSSIEIRSFSLLGCRGVLGKVLCDLASIDQRIWSMTADQGAGAAVARFKALFPDRFLNMGISEQNAIGVAAGLANEGNIPFIAFQSVFASMRCTDQVRVNMGYMALNIKLVGIFCGVTQCDCGPTHYALQDIAVMRSIPNIVVLSPSDSLMTAKIIDAVAKIDCPAYIRLDGRVNLPIVYKNDFDFEIGKAITLQEGDDICIIATGSMVYNSLKAAADLAKEGLSVGVIDMHTIKPLDIAAVKRAAQSKLIVTVEEHAKTGGLGGAVAETLSLEVKRPPHLIIGADDYYAHAGEYEYLIETYGLTASKVAEKIFKTYKEIVK